MTTLVWFRQDLRLADNPALAWAIARGGPVIPVFVLEDVAGGGRPPGGAARWWLHHSLAALDRDLRDRGSRLILRRGDALSALRHIAGETGATAVVWNRRYEPDAIARDTRIKTTLAADGLAVHSTNSALLFEPWTVKTATGGPYRVFTPFWRACRDSVDATLQPSPPSILPAPDAWPATDALDDWGLRPTKPDWAGGLRDTWNPGEAGARTRLDTFLDTGLTTYRDRRDLPAADATSRLSPHLHWGEIGPRQVWAAVEARRQAGALDGADAQAECFLREVVWREFSYHLLYHFPQLPDANLDGKFTQMPWADDAGALAAWQRGQTGYTIVDAGMRQLYATGWMHNRVRMVVASFLTKHLMVHWRHGEAWFWDTLVDADLANNAASWQWVAGCGADAAPFFRIFNPMLQGEKFDPTGDYVRRWVPELARLPAPHIHEPAKAPAAVLHEAGVRIGRDYPDPIVEHKAARQRALDAYQAVKQAA